MLDIDLWVILQYPESFKKVLRNDEGRTVLCVNTVESHGITGCTYNYDYRQGYPPVALHGSKMN
jgi:hypothetical protein